MGENNKRRRVIKETDEQGREIGQVTAYQLAKSGFKVLGIDLNIQRLK